MRRARCPIERRSGSGSSRSVALKQLNAELAWYRADGSEISRSKHSVNLPASTADYRAYIRGDLIEQKRLVEELGLKQE